MVFGFIDDIIRKIEDWITGHSSDGGDKNPDLVPVLLVPGIGASILNAVDEKGNEERVWVRIFLAEREFKRKMWSRYDPTTGKTVSLDPSTRIEVPDDNYGLFCCDILDPALIIRLNILFNFHDLIQQLSTWGYSEGTTLFGYGYDFRQSNRLPDAIDGLKLRLEKIRKISGGKKVNIISHSMGGLLVKSFLGQQPNEFERLVNSWITVSTPFQGAPGYITDCLLTGVEFLKGWQKEFWISKWSTHQLLVECPSVYEMLASLTHKWQRPPELRIWKKASTCGNKPVFHAYGPFESISVIEGALRDNTLSYNGETIPIPFNREILKWSNESRELWGNAKLPHGFKFYNIYGTSCDTAFDVCYGSEEKPIDELKDILHTDADFVYVDGDGTVPSESSMADGLAATARYGVPGDHRGLLRSQRLFELIGDILNVEKEKRVAMNAALLSASIQKEEKVISRVSQTCLAVAPTARRWETISEDSQDYNETEDKEEKFETVCALELRNVRAEAHSTAEVHEQVHDEFQEEHTMVSTVAVAEGDNEEALEEAIQAIMKQSLQRLKEQLGVDT